MKIGTIIKSKVDGEGFFFKGDKGRVISFDDADGYLVSFNGFNNPEVVDEGTWYIHKDDCEIVDIIEVFVNELRELTDDERGEIFAHFCRHCGNYTGEELCYCWRDE